MHKRLEPKDRGELWKVPKEGGGDMIPRRPPVAGGAGASAGWPVCRCGVQAVVPSTCQAPRVVLWLPSLALSAAPARVLGSESG